MNKTPIQFLFLTLGCGALCFTAACDREPPVPEAEDGARSTAEESNFDEVKRETGEAARAAGQYLRTKTAESRAAIGKALDRFRDATYDEREAFRSAADESLQELDREWNEFKQKAAGKSDEAKAKTERLREKAAAKLEETKDASAEAWPEVRDGFRNAFEELKAAFARAEQEYEEETSPDAPTEERP